MPAPPYSGGKIIPSIPSLPSSLMVASGNSPASSHFMTLGLISRSANSRTLFFSCSCSSFSRKSKVQLPDQWFFESQSIVGEFANALRPTTRYAQYSGLASYRPTQNPREDRNEVGESEECE